MLLQPIDIFVFRRNTAQIVQREQRHRFAVRTASLQLILTAPYGMGACPRQAGEIIGVKRLIELVAAGGCRLNGERLLLCRKSTASDNAPK